MTGAITRKHEPGMGPPQFPRFFSLTMLKFSPGTQSDVNKANTVFLNSNGCILGWIDGDKGYQGRACRFEVVVLKKFIFS